MFISNKKLKGIEGDVQLLKYEMRYVQKRVDQVSCKHIKTAFIGREKKCKNCGYVLEEYSTVLDRRKGELADLKRKIAEVRRIIKSIESKEGK